MIPKGLCAVVVPACNEAAAIASVVRGARQFLPRVIVVDDGSTDATAEIARNAGAEVIPQRRSGKGAALQLGFSIALNAGIDWALAMDGDGQHDPGDIPRFVEHAASARSDMIVGDRFHDLAAMPPLRRWVNRWMSRQICDFCGIGLLDTQCGFRMIDLRVWRELTIGADHFEIESELLVRFCAAGHRVASVPIAVRYGRERSKINPLPDTVRWFNWWLRIRRELDRPAPSWNGAHAATP